MNIQQCRDTTDASVLCLPQRLYLKPYAKLHISVQLPTDKIHNKSISNWELMEKLRNMIQPNQFASLRVVKNSADCIRFEGELEVVANLEKVLSKLDNRSLTLNGWKESLKVRAMEAKSEFPTRHAWDSFFRDASNMDEMKPGERPDTIHVWNLPILWFTSSRDTFEENPLPSESIFRKCFERFGKIRCIDIPICDPYRQDMKDHITGLNTTLYDPQVYFEAYIQFSEYVAFVRAMDALRGCKLVRKGEGGGAEAATIHVDFDKTKHMTDTSLKRRDMVRERLAARQRAKEEKEREEINRVAKKEEQERRRHQQAEREVLEKMKDREERRKKKQLAKIAAGEPSVKCSAGVQEEKKKLAKSIKHLQSVRLLEELFKRVQLKHSSSSRHGEYGHHRRKDRYVEAASEAARERIIGRMKDECERDVNLQRDRYKKAIEGRVVLRAALEKKKPRKQRTSSMSSLSSEGSTTKKVKIEKLTPEEAAYGPGGPYAMMPYGYGFPPHYPGYAYPQPHPLYYGNRVYYPPPDQYNPRGGPRGQRGGPRTRGRGRGRFPYFSGPNASQEYYKYFKKLAEEEADNKHRGDHDDRDSRSYSRSRSRSRHRSRYTRSRSRSRSRSRRRRSYTRSRSRSRRSRSRNRSRSRSRSRRRSRSRSRSKSRRRSPEHRSPQKPPEKTIEKDIKTPEKRISRSKSWSLPKEGANAKEKSWSKSPPKDQ